MVEWEIWQETSSFEISVLPRYRLFIVSVGLSLITHRCHVHLANEIYSGLLHLFGNVLEMLEASHSHDMDWILHHWGQAGEETDSWAHWPTDATGDIHPVNCQSHNDYWRSVPLYAAIYAGCTGAEADVWLVDDELYVGHRRIALTPNRTLKNLYIEPLLDLLENQNSPITYRPDEDYPVHLLDKPPLNGLFDVDPTQTFVLLIDFKTSGPALWWKLIDQLVPLRERGYLTHFDGSEIVQKPITVVGTGNAPFDFLRQPKPTATSSSTHP